MNDTVQTEILTLEDLQQQKAEALEELRAQQQNYGRYRPEPVCSDCSRCGQRNSYHACV